MGAIAEGLVCLLPRLPEVLPLLCLRGCLKCPVGIRAERVIDEEHPCAIRQFPVHLHSVMVHFCRIAFFADTSDQPLRAGRCEVPPAMVV